MPRHPHNRFTKEWMTMQDQNSQPPDLDGQFRLWAPRAVLVRLAPVFGTDPDRPRFVVDVLDRDGDELRGSELVWGTRPLMANMLTAAYPDARWECAQEYRLGTRDTAGALAPQMLNARCVGCDRAIRVLSTSAPADRRCAECTARAAVALDLCDPGDNEDCASEFIDGAWTYCGCPECEQREYEDAAG